MENRLNYNSYGFRFKGDYQDKVAGLNAMGFELQQSQEYKWHGLNRGENDVFIFQYTTNGYGIIQIGDKTFNLEKGEAFFVKVPSNHCYYLPHNSNEWEFLYFTIYGDEVSRLFNIIVNTYGNIFKLPLHSKPIKHIIETLEKVDTIGINHGYDASSCAYAFIMKCLEYFEYGYQHSDDFPLSITKAINFIEKHYQEDISLDDIVKVSNLSKYHFTRQFKKSIKETPINFLAKTRINKSLILLTSDDKNIEYIAQEVGYTSSNYFSKVFKKFIGTTPNNYRKTINIMPVDKVFTD
ncbi:AraC family transcriptional regulator [Staphylococcus equorum]|uniref:AraC family transcriptional regulator n=1 Tax=Staphylococcus equorum TaxID=246432 RepID=UPI0020CF1E85|nr:AraC family transcriptional regulator [Staphylococcus equorum]MEB7717657.1 AraC family transcriptional regulator [Staphylococcus equorum]MEB7758851.1 AraC family transcriptional regulator [Staphylococcus equorum]MEB7761435.1 AraC family transcriptional regulator [Staphylococcus equorum]MEB7794371.1 AraC family transcriptional regulator [Staphylococcus equorum]UTT56036.1 AraC family transcriptional regulator [Staphylococcus equorum]